MTPEEKITVLGKIGEQIKALDADYAGYMAGFNAQVSALFDQIKEVHDTPTGPSPAVVKPKRAYTRRAKKDVVVAEPADWTAGSEGRP